MKLNLLIFCRSIIAIVLITTCYSGYAQNGAHDEGNTLVINHLFSDYNESETPKRRALLNSSQSSRAAKLNPLTYMASGLLFVYQNVFSEQISAVCTYEVSCSEITKKSIEREGLIKGTLIGFHQLTNCSPSLLHDHEAHAISEDDKIINSLRYE